MPEKSGCDVVLFHKLDRIVIKQGNQMDNNTEIYELMQLIAAKGLRMLANVKQIPVPLAEFSELFGTLWNDHQTIVNAIFTQPEQTSHIQIIYLQDAIQLLHDQLLFWQEGKMKPITDKRFASKEWVNNPFFNLLSQQYLLASEHLNLLLKKLEFNDASLARRAEFFINQYLDALSPTNFLYTNPQLITETIQSQGTNLLRGMHNFITDIDTDSQQLVIKMTDVNSFKPGMNLAVTAGNVIFKNELMELIQYTPVTSKICSVPLLIIPPWINKYYILDLSPQNSMIRWLVEQGIHVFVISWINPGTDYANKGLYNYINEGPMAAIKIIQAQLNVTQVNALGFCIGGTLLAMLLAYYKTQQESPISSATFLATMIDFSDTGDIAVFIDEKQISKLEEHMQIKGYLEGHIMAGAFNSLRARDLIWSFFIKNYLQGKTQTAFDILYWNADSTNMPALMHSQYLRWMYLHNDLIKPGKIHINGSPLDVSQIDVPTFFVSTQKDHIAPWQTTYKGFQNIKGKKRFLLGGSGHIAGIIIPPGSDKYGYYQNDTCASTPENWLANATLYSGSWWPEWLSWLKGESGCLINAPDIATLPYQAIMAAPGSYVHLDSKLV